MKNKYSLLIIIFFIFFSNFYVLSQKYYNFKLTYDSISNQNIQIGEINENFFISDTNFNWIINDKNFKLNNKLILTKKDSNINYLIFLGVWCSDSKNIIPEFINYLKVKSKKLDNQMFISLDRNKEGLSNLNNLFNIKNVPTIIGFRDGQEIFRIVEYGKSNDWQKELIKLLK